MKKAKYVLLVLMMVLSLASCGKSSGNGESTLYGTWNAVKVKVEDSQFTIEELEAMGDYTMSDLFFIIKEGGKAYVHSEGYGELVDWSSTSDGIKIGVIECSENDGFICVENNDITIFMEKTSDSQTITAVSNKETPNDSKTEDKVLDLAPGEHVVSGFDEATNQKLSFGGIDFSFPSYFDVLAGDSNESKVHYYPKAENYFASLIFESDDSATSQGEFDKNKGILAEYVLANYLKPAFNDNVELLKSEDIIIAGNSGKILICGNEDSALGYSFIFNANEKKIIGVLLKYDSKDMSNYDYMGDYEKILVTAKPSSNNSSNNTIVTSTASGGWRQFLKDYEEFVDDYITFMKKYQANPTDTSLMVDYIDMMTKVSEWSENLDEFGDELNDSAELAEYTKEYMRILAKLNTGLLE